MTKYLIGLALASILTAAPVLAEDLSSAEFNQGLNAFIKGDHNTAIRLWAPLAKKGDRDAQYHLGHMYQTGTGVHKDEMQAFRWYSLAAAKGHTTASYKVKHWDIEKRKVARAID